jgi:hypothetical protein
MNGYYNAAGSRGFPISSSTAPIGPSPWQPGYQYVAPASPYTASNVQLVLANNLIAMVSQTITLLQSFVPALLSAPTPMYAMPLHNNSATNIVRPQPVPTTTSPPTITVHTTPTPPQHRALPRNNWSHSPPASPNLTHNNTVPSTLQTPNRIRLRASSSPFTPPQRQSPPLAPTTAPPRNSDSVALVKSSHVYPNSALSRSISTDVNIKPPVPTILIPLPLPTAALTSSSFSQSDSAPLVKSSHDPSKNTARSHSLASLDASASAITKPSSATTKPPSVTTKPSPATKPSSVATYPSLIRQFNIERTELRQPIESLLLQYGLCPFEDDPVNPDDCDRPFQLIHSYLNGPVTPDNIDCTGHYMAARNAITCALPESLTTAQTQTDDGEELTCRTAVSDLVMDYIAPSRMAPTSGRHPKGLHIVSGEKGHDKANQYIRSTLLVNELMLIFGRWDIIDTIYRYESTAASSAVPALNTLIPLSNSFAVLADEGNDDFD